MFCLHFVHTGRVPVEAINENKKREKQIKEVFTLFSLIFDFNLILIVGRKYNKIKSLVNQKTRVTKYIWQIS